MAKLALGSVLLATALTGCGSNASPPSSSSTTISSAAPPATVKAEDYKFVPTKVTVHVGTQFTVENDGAVAHTFAIAHTSTNIFLNPGAQQVVTAPLKAGTYAFRCTIHPAMTGTLIVQ